jgi:hypothetical protein
MLQLSCLAHGRGKHDDQMGSDVITAAGRETIRLIKKETIRSKPLPL